MLVPVLFTVPERHFFTSCLLADLRKTIEVHDDIDSFKATKALFAVDEAGALIGDWDRGKRLSPLSVEITELRGAEIALCLFYHTLQKISPAIRSNSYYTLIGNLSFGPDIRDASQAAALTRAQAEAIPHLPRGNAIMRCSGGHTLPFLVKWDDVPAHPRMTEEERLRNNAPLLAQLPRIIPEDYGKLHLSSDLLNALL
jgi:hypothetical protein